MKILQGSMVALLVAACSSMASAQERRAGRRVDLLKGLKPTEAGVGGTWVKTAAGGIRSDSETTTRLRLGKAPDGEYDLVVAFTRQGGDGRMGVILSYDGSRFGWFLGEGRDHAASGFAWVNGRGGWESDDATGLNVAADARKHILRIKARKEGVSAWIDRKKVGDVADYASLTLHEDQSVGEGMLGLVSDKPSIVFHSISMTPYVEMLQDAAAPSSPNERPVRPARDDANIASAALTTGSIWSGSKADNHSDTNGCTLHVNERSGHDVVVEIRCGREHVLWSFAIKGKTLNSTAFQDLSGQGLRSDASASGTINGRSLHLRYRWTFSSKKRKNNLVMGELQFERSE